MLINRTYRTWYCDYETNQNRTQEYRSNSTLRCPNKITELTADITSGLDYVSDGFLAVNVNLSGGNVSRYIELYNRDSGSFSYDRTPIYGVVSDTDVTAFSFLRMRINDNYYYIKTYTGVSAGGCASNMVGAETNDGTFTSAGFVIVNINDLILRFIQVYMMT